MLVRELTEVLRQLVADGSRYPILDVEGDATYFVQFLPFDGGCLVCEAVSNVFLDSRYRLSELQEQAMVDLGWDAPCPNYTMVWEPPVPVHVVAERW